MVHPIVNSIIYLSGDSERSRLGAPNYSSCFCILQVCPQYSVPPELFGARNMCDNIVCSNPASEGNSSQNSQG